MVKIVNRITNWERALKRAAGGWLVSHKADTFDKSSSTVGEFVQKTDDDSMLL